MLNCGKEVEKSRRKRKTVGKEEEESRRKRKTVGKEAGKELSVWV